MKHIRIFDRPAGMKGTSRRQLRKIEKKILLKKEKGECSMEYTDSCNNEVENILRKNGCKVVDRSTYEKNMRIISWKN